MVTMMWCLSYNESGADAVIVSPDSPAVLRTVVDHGVVVVPEYVGRGLRGFPQIAVQLQLRPGFDEFLMRATGFFFCRGRGGLFRTFVLHLDLSKGVWK